MPRSNEHYNTGPSPSFMERLRGKRTSDIHLPTPAGAKRDARIKEKKPVDFTSMRKNWDKFKSLGETKR